MIGFLFWEEGEGEGESSGMHTLPAQKRKRNEKSPSAKIVTIRPYPHKVSDNTI